MIPPLINFIVYVPTIAGVLVLLVLVAMNGSKALVNRLFVVWTAFIAGYLVASLLGALATAPDRVLYYSRLSSCFGAVMPGLLLWLAWIFPKFRPLPKWSWLVAVPVLVMPVLVWFPGFAQSVAVTPTGVIVQSGWITYTLQAYAALYTTWSMVYLYRRVGRVESRYKNQIRFMVYGITLAFILNMIIGLPLPVKLSPTLMLFIGTPSIFVMAVAIGYAMVRHNLFDVRPLVARSIAYALLLVTMSSLYGTAVFSVSKLFFRSNQITSLQQFVYTILAILLAFSFQPLRRFFEHMTDRVFFRDTYDTEEVLGQLGEIILSEIILNRLLKKTLAQLCRRLRISSGHFLVQRLGKIGEVASYGKPLQATLTMEQIRTLGEPIVVADVLDDARKRQLMAQLDARTSVLLRTKDQFIGFLLLGDKLSGDVYTNQDLDLLKILSSQLAVAISNALAYEQVSNFNATLKARVGHATARLRVANHHLKDLDNAKDEFISMASHQLRAPLTTIKGYVSMMLEGDAEPLKPKQRKFAQMAFESTERMVYVIADLLNVSRLSAGRFIMEDEPCNLGQLVQDEVRLLRNHAETKGLKLVVMTPRTLPSLEIDAGKVRQVIINYLDNAIYYTNSGSITVTLSKAGDKLRLAVTDTGIGVPNAAKKRLFTKFYRADNAQNIRPDGTGLGLFLAKKIIEAEGGQVLFESTEGQGSTFGFELPIKSATHNHAASAPKPAAVAD